MYFMSEIEITSGRLGEVLVQEPSIPSIRYGIMADDLYDDLQNSPNKPPQLDVLRNAWLVEDDTPTAPHSTTRALLKAFMGTIRAEGIYCSIGSGKVDADNGATYGVIYLLTETDRVDSLAEKQHELAERLNETLVGLHSPLRLPT
jgi:hypothetical protein